MNTQALAPAPAHKPVNPGILAMRAALARKREQALANPQAPAPKPERKPKPAKAHTPAPQADADEPEHVCGWHVGVLVKAGDAQTCLWATVQAPGPRRAGRMARAVLAQAGHVTVGVCATLREDAPAAVLAVCR